MADVLPSDALVDEPSDHGSLKPGSRLGRYELIAPVARGGMARVWAARLHGNRGFQKLVAIKTILPHLAREVEFERMFLDEARIASGVHHPNVCEIYELGEDRGVLYLAMEWVGGDSLSRVLRASGALEAIDPRIAARIVADACAGVHAAHELTDEDGRELGVVHRDLSPHNLLLTADGVTKVVDFGVAKALGQMHDTTRTGQLKGKVAYMSPEQISGQPLDRRSDIFALGCVLYEASTGTRPFPGEGDHQILHAIMRGDVRPPSAMVRGYPVDLERIIMRALALQPILRYPTAERMRFALEEFLARGALATQSHVGQAVRARIGDQIERRKERIRQAPAQASASQRPPSPSTVAAEEAEGHRSGIKEARAGAGEGKPLFTTLPLPPAGAPGGPWLRSQAPSGRPEAPSMGPSARSSSSRPPPLPARASLGAPRPSLAGGSSVPPAFAGTVPIPPFPSPEPPRTARMSASRPPMPSETGSRLPPTAAMAPMRSTAASLTPASEEAALAPASREGPGAIHYLAATGVGLVAAAIIGLGAYFGLRAREREQGRAPEAVSAAPSTSAGATAPTPVASSAWAAKAEIAFAVTPESAVIEVDGHEMAFGQRSLPRPAVGTTTSVIVRAPGYKDQTLLVDYFTSSPVAIALVGAVPSTELDTPVVQELPAEPARSPGAPASAAPRAERTRAEPRAGISAEPSLPANPY